MPDCFFNHVVAIVAGCIFDLTENSFISSIALNNSTSQPGSLCLQSEEVDFEKSLLLETPSGTSDTF